MLARAYALLIYLLMILGLGYIVLVGGGVVSGAYFRWQATTFGLTVGLSGVWLLWRGISQRARWPAIGVEWALVVAGLAAGLSWAASPDWRVGAARVFQLAGFALVFYLAIDVLDAGFPRTAIIDALIVVSGAALAMSLLEVYAYYFGRWEALWTQELYRPVTLLDHPNLLMGLSNLVLPFLFTAWQRYRNAWARSGMILWGVAYVANIPFASSRGAMLGLAIMIAVVLGYEIRRRQFDLVQQGLDQLRGYGKWWVIGGGGLIVAALALLLVYQSASPSHGGIFSRFSIWAVAVEIIADHFWLGAGPGRFGFEAAHVASTPPGFWPIHAHSVFWQTFGEFGLVGVLALAGLVGIFGRAALRAIKVSSGPARLEAVAGGLGLLGYAAQNVVDDQTHVLATMIPLMLICALVITASPIRRSRTPMISLGVLLAIVWGFQAQWLYAYAAFDEARQRYDVGDVAGAYELTQAAGQRDPAFAFYATSAGLLAAELGDWPDAKQHFERAVKVEAGLAMTQANLGIARWQAGDRAGGREAMEAAAAIAPQAPTIRLAAGQLAESQGEETAAEAHYAAALTQRPDWRENAFWQATPLRQKIWALVPAGSPESSPAAVARALTVGEIETARTLLEAYFETENLWLPEETRMRLLNGDLALAEGRIEAAMEDYRQSLFVLANPSLEGTGYRFWSRYGIWLYEREPLPMDAAPGLRPLDYDPATDLPRFERLTEWMWNNQSCADSRRVDRALLMLEPDNLAARSRLYQLCQ